MQTYRARYMLARSTWRGCRRTASWGWRSCRTCTCVGRAESVSAARLCRAGCTARVQLGVAPCAGTNAGERSASKHARAKSRGRGAQTRKAHHRRSPSARRWLRERRRSSVARSSASTSAVRKACAPPQPHIFLACEPVRADARAGSQQASGARTLRRADGRKAQAHRRSCRPCRRSCRRRTCRRARRRRRALRSSTSARKKQAPKRCRSSPAARESRPARRSCSAARSPAPGALYCRCLALEPPWGVAAEVPHAPAERVAMARRAGMAETEKKVAKADMLRAVGGQAHPQAEKHKSTAQGLRRSRS